ncbi:MAG TPA: hypothetical protein VEH84_19165 [Alphaproteobacteria bacterium]|nr:hypothetical protein [Alphaproteobacteria bacterium]
METFTSQSLACAGWLLTMQLLTKMVERELLSASEVRELMDSALLQAETMQGAPGSDPELAQQTRKLLERMLSKMPAYEAS